jgi:CubicO group peptidase (beta-lactamase class C family)
MTLDSAYLRGRLADLIAEHDVPGAALGVLHDGRIVDVAAGVLNKATGVRATPDSLFQIGSISKIWTTTLLMQLVDEGKLDLDVPVAEVLPGFAVADPALTKAVTTRHLLNHTSGIDGDVFTDTGRGDDCVETYVAQMAGVARNHPIGATFSYCNSGFVLAGRIVEHLTGMSWDAALRERLVEPLGLTHTVTLPEEALRYRAALGHVGATDPQPAPASMLPRSMGPAGLISARVHDVLSFARMHLSDGRAADGEQVLSPDSAAAMTRHEVDLPNPHLDHSWGLGWHRAEWDGQQVFGHNGATIGQLAFLQVLPSRGLAVSILTNGGRADNLVAELYGEIFAELGGITVPPRVSPPEQPVSVDFTPHLGTYRRNGVTTEAVERDGKLVLKVEITGPLASTQPSHELELVPLADGRFAAQQPRAVSWSPVRFYTLDDGTEYVHVGHRASPKVNN